jgi:hypothetical protein
MEVIEYGGWRRCARLANGALELIVTLDVGPRIIRCGVPGERNQFAEMAGQMGQTGGDEWRIYGGHRLWHAPEAKPRSYFPDNQPVTAADIEEGGLRLTALPETPYGVQKEIEITLDRDAPRATVLHRITNIGVWPVELAAWALSVMSPGGEAIVPQITSETADNLLPNRTLTLWPYTDPSDPRLRLTREFLRLSGDPAATTPIKLGVPVEDGWAAYLNQGDLFVKEFLPEEAVYPDWGSNVEVYTCADFLELETLSPLARLEPGEAIEHEEVWSLHAGFTAPDDPTALREAIESRLAG